MLKQDRFSRQDYSIDSLKRDSVKSHSNPVKPEEKPRRSNSRGRDSIENRSVDSLQNASVASKGSRLSELCEDDKLKIGNLLQRLAEESEQKKKAEMEISKIKSVYEKELEQLKEQNLRLAENTRLIEERYKEVTELAKKAIKPEKPVKEEIITIEDHDQISSKRKQSPKYDHRPLQFATQAPQKTDNFLYKQEDGASSKTLPKKPPSSKKKEIKKQPESQVKKEAQRTIPIKEESVQPVNYGKTEFFNQNNDMTQPKAGRNRYLLPQRGDSLQRLEKGVSSSDEEVPKVGVVHTSETDRQERLQKQAQRAIKKELLKRDEVKKNTLADILKLKEEIADVTNTFKSVDLEKKEQEVIEKKHQFKCEIGKKLESFETMAIRTSSYREPDDEEYLQSLRAAYEEESSEDELTKRALELKRHNRRGTLEVKDKKMVDSNHNGKNLKAKAAHNAPKHILDDEEEEEGIRINRRVPQKSLPEELPTTYIGKYSHFQNAKLKGIDNNKGKISKDYLDTSEEEELKPNTNSRQVKTSKQKTIKEDVVLDGLTEDQLCLIKQMVEERLRGQEPQSRKQTKKKAQPEEPDLVINDNFYDSKFLDLVYELESQKDDSIFNY